MGWQQVDDTESINRMRGEVMTWAEAAENRKRCYKYLTECKQATPENVEANRLAVEALEMVPKLIDMINRAGWFGKDVSASVYGDCPHCGEGFVHDCSECPAIVYLNKILEVYDTIGEIQ